MKTTKAKAIISYNKEHCGIELRLPDGRRLDNDEKAVLKSLGFCWHKRDKYYYTKYTEQKMDIIRESFLKADAQFPAKTQESVMKEMALAEQANKANKPSKKATTAERVDSLEAKLDTLIELMTKGAQAQATK